MDKLIWAILEGREALIPETKFIMYSTHDWTVAQLLLFLAAENGDFLVMPFASQIVMELHSDLSDDPSEDDFWLMIRYNGKPLEFIYCVEPTQCNYSEFTAMLDDVLNFVHSSTHYEAECSQIPDQKQKT